MRPWHSAWSRSTQSASNSRRGPALNFALGKYYDDVKEFRSAFEHYRRANQILKVNADHYNHESHRQVVDDLMRVYTSSALTPTPASSASDKPVFVVGMPRSGTSLVEQILASHPAAAGAGELDFWIDTMHRNERALRQSPPDEELKSRLAAAYLQVLSRHGAEALRVIDKAPVNSDYLGLIHSVFPQARVIYVRRNPIDTCLSCYFQQFSTAQTYTMDLTDLAHYYRQHSRLAAHWRAVLPAGTLLEVPYEELIADQEQWTRNARLRGSRLGPALPRFPGHPSYRGDRERLAGAPEDLSQLGRALAQLRRIHRPLARARAAGGCMPNKRLTHEVAQ